MANCREAARFFGDAERQSMETRKYAGSFRPDHRSHPIGFPGEHIGTITMARKAAT